MTVRHYVEKPGFVEAMQYDGTNGDAVVRWLQGEWRPRGIWLRQKIRDGAPPESAVWSIVLPRIGLAPIEALIGDWIVRRDRDSPVEVYDARDFPRQFAEIESALAPPGERLVEIIEA